MNTPKSLIKNKQSKTKNNTQHLVLKSSLTQSIVMQRQQGATLIIVLLILILVSSIAAVAIRSGNTDLKVATADQVEKLLFQSNDAAFLKLEKEDRAKAASTSLADLKGFITGDQVKVGESVVLCVRPKQNYLFKMDSISLLTTARTTYQDYKTGFCDATKEDDYISGKGRVLTQMTFIKKDVQEAKREKFSNMAKSTDSNDLEVAGKEGVSSTCVKFTGYTTSILPAMGSASLGDINTCLKKSYVTKGDTVSDCLNSKGAAYETHFQVYQNIPKGYSCL